MGQKEKKARKYVANKSKQMKFARKYKNYDPPQKFILKNPQVNKEEIEVQQESREPIIQDTGKFFKEIENKIVQEKKEETEE